MDRLQAVEKELAALKGASAQKDDVGKVRGEMKKVYDGLHLELLDRPALTPDSYGPAGGTPQLG